MLPWDSVGEIYSYISKAQGILNLCTPRQQALNRLCLNSVGVRFEKQGLQWKTNLVIAPKIVCWQGTNSQILWNKRCGCCPIVGVDVSNIQTPLLVDILGVFTPACLVFFIVVLYVLYPFHHIPHAFSFLLSIPLSYPLTTTVPSFFSLNFPVCLFLSSCLHQKQQQQQQSFKVLYTVKPLASNNSWTVLPSQAFKICVTTAVQNISSCQRLQF